MMPPPLNTGSRPVKDIEPRVSAESPMLAPLASKSRVPQMPKITARPSPTLQALPDELLVHIISFLLPEDVVPLHTTSNRLRSLTRRDPHFWRNATIYSHEARLRQGRKSSSAPIPLFSQPQQTSSNTREGLDGTTTSRNGYDRHLPVNMKSSQHTKVDWYEEWKWRFAPLKMEWFNHYSDRKPCGDGAVEDEDDGETGCNSSSYPSTCSSSVSLNSISNSQSTIDGVTQQMERLEVRGITAFSSVSSSREKDLLLSPLSDGSVVVFDLRRKMRRSWECEDKRGSVLGRSKPGLVSVESSSGGGSYLVGGNGGALGAQAIKTIAPTGVVECVSVDSWSERGWVGVENRLVEFDLRTLRHIHTHRYQFTITSLSQTSHPFPLTVGTTNMLHMYDPRISGSTTSAAAPHATLFQPGPLSILHSNGGASASGGASGGEEMIYVAGRFPSILLYERRMFPRLKFPLHSGARLCTLSAFPAASSHSPETTSDGGTVADNGSHTKSNTGELKEMLVAAGEYNGRGTLEIYPSPYGNPRGIFPLNNINLLPHHGAHHNHHSSRRHSEMHGGQHSGARAITDNMSTQATSAFDIVIRNRQSASRAKILTVDATQGGRIVTGDAEGVIRFMERDGRGEVRRFDLGNNGDDDLCCRHQRGGCSGLGAGRIYGGGGNGRVWGDGDVGYRVAGGDNEHGGGEVVRKVIALGGTGYNRFGSEEEVGEEPMKTDGLGSESGVVVWTGERVGVLSVGKRKCKMTLAATRREIDGPFGGGNAEASDNEEGETEEARYRRQMRRALEAHGRESWFMSGLGRMV